MFDDWSFVKRLLNATSAEITWSAARCGLKRTRQMDAMSSDLVDMGVALAKHHGYSEAENWRAGIVVKSFPELCRSVFDGAVVVENEQHWYYRHGKPKRGGTRPAGIVYVDGYPKGLRWACLLANDC